jgi:DNA mismatch endonuclease (patch repair protein)
VTDNKTREQRSYNMSRIRGMNTFPECIVRRIAYTRGLRYRTRAMHLPGRPDMMFPRQRVLVFIDGDFWHDWQFSRWRDRLSEYRRAKIERNGCRDRRTVARPRRAGRAVVRLWEHEVVEDAETCVDRIEAALR